MPRSGFKLSSSGERQGINPRLRPLFYRSFFRIVVKTVVKRHFLTQKKPRNLNDFKAFQKMLMAGLEPARSGSRGF